MRYFGYGMNTNTDSMRARCPDARCCGVATLPGYHLEFAVHCNVVVDYNSVVQGLLWDISDSDLCSLDLTEGYPSYYNRILLPVISQDTGLRQEAWVYVMTDETIPSPPGLGYWNLVMAGYIENNINTQQLHNALVESHMQPINYET